MQKCAEAVAVWLVRCQVIEEQEKELYCYAMESFVMFWSPMILALLLGTIMGRVKEGILVIIPFMMIRKFSGGYHAKNLWICLTCSSLLLFLCALHSYNIPQDILDKLRLCSQEDIELTKDFVELLVVRNSTNHATIYSHTKK